jgi:hypothetical protein
MRAAAIFLALGALVGFFASIALGVLREDGRRAAELRLEPTAAGGPEGVGALEHDDGRLTGWIVVWGLEPGSRHAVHFHGPDSACGTQANPVAVHPDLEADGDGVASVRLDVEAPAGVVEAGTYYNVHASPSSEAENPEIACGDVEPE